VTIEGVEGVTSVGTPVVHRYIRDEGEEWAMWFSARDGGIDEKIVKLSTGRIYKAVSKDGMTWKPEEGVGENGASLDPNTDEWWGFDTAHLGLGDVRLGQPDKVMTMGGVYTMYYFGGTFAEQPISDLTGTDAEGSVTGMDFRVGVALSQNGVNWSRLEGEHPTGCALDHGKSQDDFDRNFLAWPFVVNHGSVDNRDGKSIYRLYYSSLDTRSSPPRYTLGLATSEDSFKWTKLGPCFMGSGAGFDEGGVKRAFVRKLGEDSHYTMFYEAKSAKGEHSIGLATSTDGVSWSVSNDGEPVLSHDPDDASEAKAVGAPYAVEMDDGSLRMYYVGTAADGACSIKVATADTKDLSKWSKVGTSA